MNTMTKALLALGIAVSATAVHAELITGTGEITATPAPLALEEIRPFQMELVAKQGADMSAGFSLDSGRLTYLAEDPLTNLIKGCVKVTGPASSKLYVAVNTVGDLSAPGGAVIAANSTRLSVANSTAGCDAPESAGLVGPSAVTGPVGDSYSTDANGEAWLVWEYEITSMNVNAWEEGVYTGTVDFEISTEAF